MDEAAEAVAALNRGCTPVEVAAARLRRIWRAEVECPVWPVAVVVLDEDAEDALEVAPVHDQESVEAF